MEITEIIEQYFLGVVGVVGTLLTVFIIPFIWRTIDNYKLKKLKKDLIAKYGEDAFNAAS